MGGEEALEGQEAFRRDKNAQRQEAGKLSLEVPRHTSPTLKLSLIQSALQHSILNIRSSVLDTSRGSVFCRLHLKQSVKLADLTPTA